MLNWQIKLDNQLYDSKDRKILMNILIIKKFKEEIL